MMNEILCGVKSFASESVYLDVITCMNSTLNVCVCKREHCVWIRVMVQVYGMLEIYIRFSILIMGY